YERPATLGLLPEVNGIDVLDAGCGHGWYAEWLLRHGARVVAVDRSAAMIALAQERLAGRGRVIQGDTSDLRGILADATFDLVLSSLVLHYQANLSTVFAEWARLLRPAGVAVISTHSSGPRPGQHPRSRLPACRVDRGGVGMAWRENALL